MATTEPTLDPPYNGLPGKPPSLLVECVPNSNSIKITYNAWDKVSRNVNVEGPSGRVGALFEYGSSVTVPNVDGWTIHYFAGAEWIYRIIPGECGASESPSTSSSTLPPSVPSTTIPTPESTTTTNSSTTPTTPATQDITETSMTLDVAERPNITSPTLIPATAISRPNTEISTLPATGVEDAVVTYGSMLGVGLIVGGVLAIIATRRKVTSKGTR